MVQNCWTTSRCNFNQARFLNVELTKKDAFAPNLALADHINWGGYPLAFPLLDRPPIVVPRSKFPIGASQVHPIRKGSSLSVKDIATSGQIVEAILPYYRAERQPFDETQCFMHALAEQRAINMGNIFKYSYDRLQETLATEIESSNRLLVKTDLREFYPSVTGELLISTLSDRVSTKVMDEILNWYCSVGKCLPQGYQLADMLASLCFLRLIKDCNAHGLRLLTLNDDIYFFARNHLEAGRDLAMLTSIAEEYSFALGFQKTGIYSGKARRYVADFGHLGGVEIEKYLSDCDHGVEEHQDGTWATNQYGCQMVERWNSKLDWDRLILNEFIVGFCPSESLAKAGIRNMSKQFLNECGSLLCQKYPTLSVDTCINLPQERRLEFAKESAERIVCGGSVAGDVTAFLKVCGKFKDFVLKPSMLRVFCSRPLPPMAEVAVNCQVGNTSDRTMGLSVFSRISEEAPLELLLSRVRALRSCEPGLRRDLYNLTKRQNPCVEEFIKQELERAA